MILRKAMHILKHPQKKKRISTYNESGEICIYEHFLIFYNLISLSIGQQFWGEKYQLEIN